MIGGLDITKVLEVGTNRAHNLLTISEIYPNSKLIGIEPNDYAIQQARGLSRRYSVLKGTVFDLPFRDQYFDLVFTCGVLIHIHLNDLLDALKEIYRVSRRYILCVEYYAGRETVISYRGYDNLLWKRDFKTHYMKLFPDPKLIREGYWEKKFDRSNWWLFQK